jgi:hypothetical protein
MGRSVSTAGLPEVVVVTIAQTIGEIVALAMAVGRWMPVPAVAEFDFRDPCKREPAAKDFRHLVTMAPFERKRLCAVKIPLELRQRER